MNDVNSYILRVAEFFNITLGSALIEVYQLGSLAHGGFSAVYSDIDVGVLVNSVEPPVGITEAIGTAKEMDAEYGKKLSMFWGNPDYSWGRLPVIDRLDLLDHGVPLLRGYKPNFSRPSEKEIHRALHESFDRSYRSRLPELSSLSRLQAHQCKPYIRTVLYPARLIYTWDQLRVDSNDRAVEYLHQISPPGLALEPIDLALACRQERCTAADVLALAPDLNAQFDAMIRYVSARSEGWR